MTNYYRTGSPAFFSARDFFIPGEQNQYFGDFIISI